MLKNSLSVIASLSFLLLTGCGAVLPKVIETYPQNGAQNVDPALPEIWVKFNKPMLDKSWSWSYEEQNKFPQMNGEPNYTNNDTKCILPVKLEPNKEYLIWINTINHKNFKDKAGNPVEPYKLTFKTRLIQNIDYSIDNKTVTEEVFSQFLVGLKEIQHTWFCAETSDGGITGYDATDTNGVVYEYRVISASNRNKSSIRKKFN